MKWLRRASLPTGTALIEEAKQLGVSLEGLQPSMQEAIRRNALGADPADPANEPEIQSRVLAARAERHTANINLFQTIGIVGSLLLTLGLALWNGHLQSQRESAGMMVKFSDMLDAGGSGALSAELDIDGNLDHPKVGADVLDKEMDDFLGKYELLAEAYRYKLINDDMAYDAFSYDLEKALKDLTVRKYLTDARRQDGDDIYEGATDLAKDWGFPFVPLSSPMPAAVHR